MVMDIPFGTFGEELPKEPTKITAIVDCENQGKMLNEVRGYQVTERGGTGPSPHETERKERVLLGGRQEEHTFYVDEPPRLGGDGKYPQPLTYIAGGVGS